MSKNNLVIEREKLQLTMSRVFAAPRQRLWDAHANADQVKIWFGGSNDVKIEEFDFKVGGKWRFVNTGDDGSLHVFYGVYKEIEEPEKITWTFEYEPWAGHVLTESFIFEELPDGSTKLTNTAHYANIEDLVGMVESGMEEGAIASWDELEKLVTQQ